MPCPADLLSGNWLATKLRPAEPFNCAEEKKYFSLSGSRSPQNIQIENKIPFDPMVWPVINKNIWHSI